MIGLIGFALTVFVGVLIGGVWVRNSPAIWLDRFFDGVEARIVLVLSWFGVKGIWDDE